MLIRPGNVLTPGPLFNRAPPPTTGVGALSSTMMLTTTMGRQPAPWEGATGPMPTSSTPPPGAERWAALPLREECEITEAGIRYGQEKETKPMPTPLCSHTLAPPCAKVPHQIQSPHQSRPAPYPSSPHREAPPQSLNLRRPHPAPYPSSPNREAPPQNLNPRRPHRACKPSFTITGRQSATPRVKRRPESSARR